MSETDIRFWLEIAFWALLVGSVLNGERLARKHDREFWEREVGGRGDGS